MRDNDRPLHLRRLMIAVGLIALVLAAMACNRSRGDNPQTGTGPQNQPVTPVERVTATPVPAPTVEEPAEQPPAEPTLDPADEIEATLDALIEQLEGDDPLDDLDF